MENNIFEGLSSSQSAVAISHWENWDEFFRYVCVYPLLVSYIDLVLVLKAFALQYRTRYIDPRKCQVQSSTVENNMQFIGQSLTALGYKDLLLKIQFNITF